MNEKLSIVTTTGANTTFDIKIDGETKTCSPIFVTGNNENSRLAYMKDGNLVGISEGSLHTRPIHCSELYSLLSKRGWNIMGSKYIDRSSGVPTLSSFTVLQAYNQIANDEVPSINTATSGTGFSVCTSGFGNVSSINSAELAILREFSSLYGEKQIGDITSFQTTSRPELGFFGNNLVIDLIKANSDSYTNMINLSDVIHYAASEGMTGQVDLNIVFIKNNQWWSRDVSICVFRYIKNSNGNLVVEVQDQIQEIDSLVSIEYMGETIRVIPISEDVTECIINNCSLIYGNI